MDPQPELATPVSYVCGENKKIIASCEEEEEEEDRQWQYATQLACSSVLPMVLKAAIELGLLDIIERAGPGALLSPTEIASHLPLSTNKYNNPEYDVDRILRLLATHSILTSTTPHHHEYDGPQVHRLYGLAPVSKYFIRNQDGVSLAPLLELIQGKVMIDMWYHMKDAVIEGGLPFNRAYGMNASEYAGKDVKYLELFKTSMREYNFMFMRMILGKYKGFQSLKSMVDVGGGDGTILNMIVSNYPTIKGINFDLPPIIHKSPSYPGIEHIAGDMFVSIPKGDAIFMKWILHGWDDEHCLKILKNCCEALPDHGKVIVVDLVVPEAPETSIPVQSILQFDLFMMNMNPGGKERTQKEFEILAKAAGFSSIRVACCAYNFSLVEFYKKKNL
uniref:Caffeate O-methyltransferase n=1 Tax=Davidia involucrata TaxID=16924 RepID=A0A5B7BDJ6_DAVIN